MKRIGVIVGSLRKESFSRKVGNAMIEKNTDKANFEIISIDHLPIYNQDYDDYDLPVSYKEFRETVSGFDGFIFVTPEHNRSVPAALKNALDIGSRPKVDNVWDGKPCGIISTSPGRLGGFGANHHLRQSLSFLNMPTLLQPEMYFSEVHKLLEDDVRLTRYLEGFIGAFLEFALKHS